MRNLIQQKNVSCRSIHLIFLGGIIVCYIIAIGVSLGMASTFIIVSVYTKDEKNYSREKFENCFDQISENSVTYFGNQEKNYQYREIGPLRNDGNYRKLVHSLDAINNHLVNALIAIEDYQFYSHKGIVLSSVYRAAYQKITHADVITGGSTITQQLIKNVVLKNHEKSVERKAKEMMLALRLESMYTKNEILLYYINSIFFGTDASGRKLYGVQAAAERIFGVDAKKLNLSQSAYIAGMVQCPLKLNPFTKDGDGFKYGLKRMKLVLDKMLQLKKITKKEYQQALQFNIKNSFIKLCDLKNSYQQYPYLMFAIETEAAKILMTKDKLNNEELSKQGKFIETLHKYKKKLMSGYHIFTTIDEGLYKEVNQAMKVNVRLHYHTFKGKKDSEQLGAVLLNNKTGAILAFISGFNFKSNQIDHALYVENELGRLKYILPITNRSRTTVRKITALYSAFANNRYYHQPYIISKITDNRGKIIWEHHSQPTKIIHGEPSSTISKKEFDRKIKNKLHLPMRRFRISGEIAKTYGNKDLWAVGYTSQFTLGIWSGYDYNFRMKDNNFSNIAWIKIVKSVSNLSKKNNVSK